MMSIDGATLSERLDALAPDVCPPLDPRIVSRGVKVYVKARAWAARQAMGQSPGAWTGDTLDAWLARRGITWEDRATRVLYLAYEREIRRRAYDRLGWDTFGRHVFRRSRLAEGVL